jgi:hypothetical protein
VSDYDENGALAIRDAAPVAYAQPAVTPAEAKASMDAYIALCNSVLTADDYQEFKERGQTKRFKKKSAVKKLQTFFSVSVSVRDVVRDDLGGGDFGFRCIAIATTPGGRVVESTGGCTTFEDRFTPKRYDDETDARYAERCRKAKARAYHDVMSTAETRATNRAVMNVIGVGGGEVTADEISRENAGRVEPARTQAKPAFDVDAVIRKAHARGIVDSIDRANFKSVALQSGIEWTPRAITEWVDNYKAPQAVEEAAIARNATPAQRSKAMALHKELGHDDETRHAYYKLKYGVESFNALTFDQASGLIDDLQRNVEEQQKFDEFDATDEEFL